MGAFGGLSGMGYNAMEILEWQPGKKDRRVKCKCGLLLPL
jgi:hypothetical protein